LRFITRPASDGPDPWRSKGLPSFGAVYYVVSMSPTMALLLLLTVWVTFGVIASIFMGRRGHNPFAWLVLGAILGPLVIPVAAVAVHEERMRQRRQVVSGTSAEGTVDVLVGIDGSPEAQAALHAATRLFGAVIGRLTLATVEDFDSAASRTPLEIERKAAETLERAASSVEAQQPSAIILTGRPADALMRCAADEGYEVIAIGRRGRGANKALMGSTATRLTNAADVPVLVV
jgi:nucleotide-binding universal stress UspA family protein